MVLWLQKWDILRGAGHGKYDSMLSYPKEFSLWKCTKMNQNE